MGRRRTWVVQCLLIVGTVYLSAPAPTFAWPGVTKENVFRLRYGMTLKEVEAIFGQPCAETNSIQFGSDLSFWQTKDLEVEVISRKGQIGIVNFRVPGQGILWETYFPPETLTIAQRINDDLNRNNPS
jgi:hypothetical protein